MTVDQVLGLVERQVAVKFHEVVCICMHLLLLQTIVELLIDGRLLTNTLPASSRAIWHS